MSFSTDHIIIATLIKVQLPARTIHVCDGGQISFDGALYQSEDSEYGSLAAGSAISEGVDDQAPSAAITFFPNSNAAAETLTDPSLQWSPISIWVASVDGLTGQIIRAVGMFFGFIDVPTFRDGAEQRMIDMTLVSDTERFFIQNEANRLSQENHQRVHGLNELGLNNMTGVEYDVAWGTESRPGSVSTSGGGSPAFNGGGLLRAF